MRIFRLVLVLAATGLTVPGSALATVGDEPSPFYVSAQSTGGTFVTATTPLAAPITLDDQAGNVTLPFDYDFLGHHYASGTVIHPTSNGVIDFDGTTAPFSNQCLPTTYPAATRVAMPLWDDLKVNGSGEGIFTRVTGTAPARLFYIEWRGHLQTSVVNGSVSFEAILGEQHSQMAFVYGSIDGAGSTATIGLSQSSTAGSQHKQFSCNTALGAIKTVNYGYTAPVVSGLLQSGETLAAATGSFVGVPVPTQTVQWQRCSVVPVCADISGAVGTSYVSVPDDVGSTIRAQVTSANTVGSTTVLSQVYGPIIPLAEPAPVYTATAGSGAAIIPATDDIGNTSDDDSTPVTLPFPVRFYGRSYAAVNVSANGSLLFGGTDTSYNSNCLPNERGPDAFELYQSDLDGSSPGDGIFTLTTGLPPHRKFIVEWRTATHGTLTDKANFEAILYEDSPTLTAIYGNTAGQGAAQVSGVQHGQGPPSTQFSCIAATLTAGTRVDYTPSVPALTGNAVVGATLSGSAASWTATPTLSRQWRRCDADGVNCGDIPLATDASYTITGADLDHTLRLRELAVGPLTPVAESPATATVTVTAVTPPPPAPPADSQAPALSKLTFAHSAFVALAKGGSTDPKRGAALTFSLSEAASVRFSVAALLSGRRSGRSCVAPAKGKRGAKRCTRVVAVKGSFAVAGKAGANKLRITGRLAGKRLPRGSYRLTAVATDAAKNTAAPVTAKFTIKG